MEINELNYELYALDYAEGRLTGESLSAFEEFLSVNPELAEELLAISQTTVPEDAVVFAGKQALKHKAGIRTLAAYKGLWPRAAIAASLILAMGLIWTLNQQTVYGELASGAPGLTIHYSLDLIYQEQEGVDANSAAQSLKQNQYASDPIQTQNQRDRNADPGSSAEFTDFDRATNIKEELPGLQAVIVNESQQITDDAAETVPFKVKMTIVDPAVVPEDRYYVLPVTIELYDLTLEANDQARGELDRLAAADASKAARRRLIKDGALSLLQETFVPEGINNLLNN